MPGIRFIPYEEIDKTRWDNAIRSSSNSLIYAESNYLDAMADRWDALILDEYQLLMPICSREKFGIRYIYQPAFIQQLGIFGQDQNISAYTHSFLEAIPGTYRLVETTLNAVNGAQDWPQGWQVQYRTNFLRSLNNGYRTTRQGYDAYLRQRVNRAGRQGLEYRDSRDIGFAIQAYRDLYRLRIPDFSDRDYTQFGLLCGLLQESGRLIIRQAVDKTNGEVYALILLLKDDIRLYNMISCIWPEGKKKGANYFLFDQIIREFSGNPVSLDFEGSDVPGIAYFYEKFSDNKELYPFVRLNRLPWPLRILKP